MPKFGTKFTRKIIGSISNFFSQNLISPEIKSTVVCYDAI